MTFMVIKIQKYTYTSMCKGLDFEVYAFSHVSSVSISQADAGT